MFIITSNDGIGVNMIVIKKNPDINELIIEKLKKYPDDVRELAIQAIRLSESYSEKSVAEQLQAVVKKLTNKQERSDQ